MDETAWRTEPLGEVSGDVAGEAARRGAGRAFLHFLPLPLPWRRSSSTKDAAASSTAAPSARLRTGARAGSDGSVRSQGAETAAVAEGGRGRGDARLMWSASTTAETRGRSCSTPSIIPTPSTLTELAHFSLPCETLENM
jgi:hypothetical protein